VQNERIWEEKKRRMAEKEAAEKAGDGQAADDQAKT
jgi:hypothetical protein